jgi:hypothetical protein
MITGRITPLAVFVRHSTQFMRFLLPAVLLSLILVYISWRALSLLLSNPNSHLRKGINWIILVGVFIYAILVFLLQVLLIWRSMLI